VKSTYKLFGAYWDGMLLNDDQTSEIRIISTKEMPENIISFKELLTVESQNDFEDAISSLDVETPVAIRVDYWSESSNPVLCLFLEKRLGQMVARLSEIYPKVQCFRA
jgi:hypothetical protein